MRAKMTMAAFVAMAAAACLGGCAPASITGGDATLPAGEESPAFLDRVSSQKTVSENDAMRGVLMLLEGKDASETFRDRLAKLRSLRVVDSSWSCDANRPVTRGRLAYMLCQAIHVKGGVLLTLLGPSQRYCLRELRYQGIMASGIMTTEISGGEYVAVMGRADRYKAVGEVPEIERPPEPGE